jgi:hypothetical protein
VAETYQEIYFHSAGLGLGAPLERFDEVDAWMGESGTALVFVGHTHELYLREMKHGWLCNAGSVGLPLDGTPQPAWVLADGDLGRSCRLELRRSEYDLREYTALIAARPDHPDYRIPGQVPAYRRMVETGKHWKAFTPPAG